MAAANPAGTTETMLAAAGATHSRRSARISTHRGVAVTDEGKLIAGRYRLVSRLGSGAMGVVWQAHDERLHRTVAIKQVLLPSALSDIEADEANRRAMREGRITARLHHPHAIAVFDVVEYEGQPFLIMEYLPSRSLATVLSIQGVLLPDTVARIGQPEVSDRLCTRSVITDRSTQGDRDWRSAVGASAGCVECGGTALGPAGD